MITYIVKTLLCAAVLFLIYFLLLEREKMHRFNRFYLLFSIVFSLTISFITIKAPTKVVTVNELIAPTGFSNIVATINGLDKLSHNDNSIKLTVKGSTTSDILKTPTPVPVEKNIPWVNILLGFYIAGTAFLLIRFVRNLSVLLFSVARSKKVSYHGATLVLTKDNALPHSFLNYIFIDMEKFEQGTVEKEILQHELTHVNQRHSIDILLVELVMVFAWVNPLLFLFRKAIMLNHEYLADDAVVTTYNNTESYQLLLFNTVSQSNNLVLSSPFNYLITKKRLIMMTKNTSRKVAILKQIALIPLIAAIGFLLSTRAIAQDKPKQQTTQKQPVTNKTDAPQSVIKEFFAILAKYKVDTLALKTYEVKDRSKEEMDKWVKITHIDAIFKIDVAEKNRLGDLYSQMSTEQLRHTRLGFLPMPELKKKIVPTKEQFESWKNSKIYRIWIDSTRVKNSVLNSHSNTDFAYFETYTYAKASPRVLNSNVKVTLLTEANLEKENKRIAKFRSEEPAKYYIAVKPPRFIQKAQTTKTN